MLNERRMDGKFEQKVSEWGTSEGDDESDRKGEREFKKKKKRMRMNRKSPDSCSIFHGNFSGSV